MQNIHFQFQTSIHFRSVSVCCDDEFLFKFKMICLSASKTGDDVASLIQFDFSFKNGDHNLIHQEICRLMSFNFAVDVFCSFLIWFFPHRDKTL